MTGTYLYKVGNHPITRIQLNKNGTVDGAPGYMETNWQYKDEKMIFSDDIGKIHGELEKTEKNFFYGKLSNGIEVALVPSEIPKDFKIAILLSGHVRTFEKTFPYLKNNLLYKLNADIFIHSWEYKEDGTKTDIDRIIALYQPVKYIFESPIEIKQNYDFDITGLYQFRKIYECNKLITTKYDLVIRARFDTKFRTPLNLHLTENLINIYKHNVITLPSSPEWGTNEYRCNDMFSIGLQTEMTKYSEMFCNIKELLKKCKFRFHPETYLAVNMKEKGLIMNKVDINHSLVR